MNARGFLTTVFIILSMSGAPAVAGTDETIDVVSGILSTPEARQGRLKIEDALSLLPAAFASKEKNAEGQPERVRFMAHVVANSYTTMIADPQTRRELATRMFVKMTLARSPDASSPEFFDVAFRTAAAELMEQGKWTLRPSESDRLFKAELQTRRYRCRSLEDAAGSDQASNPKDLPIDEATRQAIETRFSILTAAAVAYARNPAAAYAPQPESEKEAARALLQEISAAAANLEGLSSCDASVALMQGADRLTDKRRDMVVRYLLEN